MGRKFEFGKMWAVKKYYKLGSHLLILSIKQKEFVFKKYNTFQCKINI